MDGTNQSPTEQFTAKLGHPGGVDTAPDTALRPYWIADNMDIDALPAGLRLAISEILEPAYRELVIEAATALERATGASFVHLLYLELQEQFNLGHTMPGTAVNGQVVNRQAALDRLLRLIGAKQKAANFLQRIKEWRETAGSHARDRLARRMEIILESEVVAQNRQRILEWLAARPGPVRPSGQGARIVALLRWTAARPVLPLDVPRPGQAAEPVSGRLPRFCRSGPPRAGPNASRASATARGGAAAGSGPGRLAPIQAGMGSRADQVRAVSQRFRGPRLPAAEPPRSNAVTQEKKQTMTKAPFTRRTMEGPAWRWNHARR